MSLSRVAHRLSEISNLSEARVSFIYRRGNKGRYKGADEASDENVMDERLSRRLCRSARC